MEQICQWIDEHKQDTDCKRCSAGFRTCPASKARRQAECAVWRGSTALALDTALADGQAMGFARCAMWTAMPAISAWGRSWCWSRLRILTHLDVVPVGDGWTVDPVWRALRMTDRIIGRGASDDKGPAVAVLYAMKAVLEAGMPLRREVRLILGCDEESGMEDMAILPGACRYAPKPASAPDAMYPVINTEKGHAVACALTGQAPRNRRTACEENRRWRTPQRDPRAKLQALIEGDAALMRAHQQPGQGNDSFPWKPKENERTACC